MDASGISRQKFRAAFVLILVVAVSVIFLAVTRPFLQSLLIGAMLAGLCRPLIIGSRACSTAEVHSPLR
jgi:predicted PurR-regulated permease PerM